MIFSGKIYKYYLLLFLLYILLLSFGYPFVTLVKPSLSLSDFVILLTVFSIIALITLIIFFKGETKEADSQTFTYSCSSQSEVPAGVNFCTGVVYCY